MTWIDEMRVFDAPEGVSGDWRVERFEITESHATLGLLAAMQHGRGSTPPGTYTKLMRGGTIVMSDTRDELRDHASAYFAARGQVLIVGLGLGCLLRGVLRKESVEHVDVVERSPDVIALLGEHYEKMAADLGKSLTIHEADIFEQKWPPNTHWDVAWFDIWDDLCESNLSGMSKLLRSYGRRADWKGCWGKEYIEHQRVRYRRYSGW